MQTAHPSPEPPLSASGRAKILQELARIASERASEQLEAFTSRLADALSLLAGQTVRLAEADLGLAAAGHLNANRAAFCRAVSAAITTSLLNELRLIESESQSRFEADAGDLSLVTFDEMENKVLIGNMSQGIELGNAELLAGLNLRLAHLLQREEMSLLQNPFRSSVFVQAVYESWCRLAPPAESQGLMLRQLRPDVFLQLGPIFQALNESLIARGILPTLSASYRNKKAGRTASPSEEKQPGLPLYHKLQKWLASAARPKGDAVGSAAADDSGSAWSPPANRRMIDPALLGYLADVQQQSSGLKADDGRPAIPQSAIVLRQVKILAPRGTLTTIDENTIELLARIFDFVFAEQSIPSDIRGLMGRLQIPMLKAALADREFFFKEDHPARRLMETLAKSSLAWDQDKGRDDPLYRVIEQIVERVEHDFEQQIELFSDVVDELETFIEQEELATGRALAQPVAEAMRQERMLQALQMAEKDVAVRIETGEVAGFVEIFLETKWTQVLAMAHSVVDSKPDALEKALQAMDDLIWSLKPKSTPEERKELLKKLPSMLSMVNAWLNAVKWNAPERLQFFSSLAERHAAIMREPLEMSPRRQVEMAVNAAQKASERRFSMREKELQGKPLDQFVDMVEAMECGDWFEFVRANGIAVKCKLAWISPQRSRFIFTGRHGQESFSLTASELAQALRDQKAVGVASASVVDRALASALDDIKPA